MTHLSNTLYYVSLVLFILAIPISLIAKSKDLAEIDKLYAKGNNRKVIEKSLRLIKDKQANGKVYNRLGQAYERIGDYQNALKYYTLFHSHSLKLEQNDNISLALNNLAILRARQGNLTLALDLMDKSIEIELTLNRPATLARRYTSRGGLLRRKGKLLMALNNYQKALKLNITNESFLALVYNNLGIVYHRLGQLDKAKEYFNLSLKQNISDNSQSKSMIYNNIALYEKEKGRYKQALEYYMKSLKIEEANGNKPNIAVRLNSVGSVYFAKGQYGIALEHFNQSLKLYKTFQQKIGIATLHKNMALTYRELAQFEKSLIHFTLALNHVKKNTDQQDYAIILFHMGLTQSMNKNYPEAKRLYEQSLTIFRSLHAMKNQADTLLSIAKLSVTNKRDDQKAFTLFFKANKLYTLLRNLEAQGHTYWWMGILKERDEDYKSARNFYELAHGAYTALKRKEAHVLLGMITRVNKRLTPEPKIPTKKEIEAIHRENIKSINKNGKELKSTGIKGGTESLDSLPEGESQEYEEDMKDIDLSVKDSIRLEMEHFRNLKG